MWARRLRQPDRHWRANRAFVTPEGLSYKNGAIIRYAKPAISPLAGMVITQAQTIVRANPHRTAFHR